MSEYESNTPIELAYYEKETDKGNETPDSKKTALKYNQSNEYEIKKIDYAKCWRIICFIEFTFYCLNPIAQIILYIINNNGGYASFLYFGMILICGYGIIFFIVNGGIICKYLAIMIFLYLLWGSVDFFFNDIDKNEKYENIITAIYYLKIAEAVIFLLVMISLCCLNVANGEQFCYFD